MLKTKIQEDLKIALKNKEELALATLRLLSAAILSREKEKRYKLSKEKAEFNQEELEKASQLTDEEVLEVISSEVKKRKEAILEFEKGGRPDLVAKEKKELEILEKYLPEKLPEKEIRKLAKEIIEKVGAREIKDIGKVMAELMPKIKGRAEGEKVNQIVRELLSGQ